MSGVSVPSSGEAQRGRLSFRLTRIRWPEWVVALSALVLLGSLVGLTWFTVSPRVRPLEGSTGLLPGSQSEDGWHGLAHAHWLLLVTLVAALALIFFQATRPAPAVPVTLSLLVMVLGALSTIWLLIRVLIDPPAGREFGGWLGLISAAVLTWSAYRSLRLEGIAPEDSPGTIRTVSREELAQEQNSGAGQHS